MEMVDEMYMRRCLQLARNGERNAPPNPMVGAVVVAPDGRIIGEGYHVRCGEGHAEVNALASVKAEDERLLKEATIYVSLEPCAHYGKTPPCADLIVERGLRRCVVGCIDPFAKVGGRGIEILRRAGVEVTVGVLEDECLWLNRRFMTYHRLHRPYITLKWAQTADGVIGVAGEQLRISNRLTQMICHKRRAEHEAILVGRRTQETDCPSLTVRAWVGASPRRYVLSRATGDMTAVLQQMYEQGVQSLLVEGGRETLQGFIDAGLWDEAFVETSPQMLAELLPSAVQSVAAPTLKNARKTGTERVLGHTIDAYVRQ